MSGVSRCRVTLPGRGGRDEPGKPTSRGFGVRTKSGPRPGVMSRQLSQQTLWLRRCLVEDSEFLW